MENNSNNNGGMMMKKEQQPIGNNPDDPKQKLKDVSKCIDKTLGLLHQLYLTVSSFNVASQLPLLHRINALVSELDTMTKLSSNCNIQVPVEVLQLIDDGKNPDEFTRDVLNSCISMNQITKGRSDSFKSLRNNLLHELDAAFPSEVDAYREIRAADVKRLSNGDIHHLPKPEP